MVRRGSVFYSHRYNMGTSLGVSGVLMGWGVKPMLAHSGKRIDRERIKIERSLDR